MPMPAVGIAAASIGSSAIGAISANKAAKAQERAADQQVALQREVFDEQKKMFTPYRQSGDRALAAYEYEMGLGPRPRYASAGPKQAAPSVHRPIRQAQSARLSNDETSLRRLGLGGDGRSISVVDALQAASRSGGDKDDTLIAQAALGWGQKKPQQNALSVPTDPQPSTHGALGLSAPPGVNGAGYGGFRATPGYKFRMQQGLDAVEAGAGRRHGLVSGATMQAMGQFGQNYASQEHDKYMNRLGGLMQQGQASAAMTATAGNNYAQGAGNALANAGNAAASGAIGVGNALQGGINNGLGAWMYGKGQGLF